MKKIILIMTVFFFACEEEITPIDRSDSKVLEILSDQYVEVKIEGFGSVWVNGSENIILSRGTYKFHACGNTGEFTHDGKSKLLIQCQ